MKEIYAAFVKAQAEIQEISVKKKIQAYNYKYADLKAVWEAIREPLKNNNLAVHQSVSGAPDDLRLITTITHVSGESIADGGVPLLLKNRDMQGLGSATTYARRYGLMSSLGISPEDDDGVGAGLSDNKKSKPYSKPIQKPNESNDDFF